MKKISQGAEATIHSDKKKVVKHRTKKTYRHPDIDDKLRKSRTRREAKVIEKLSSLNFPGPKLHDVCDVEMKITMDHIHGDKLRDSLGKVEKEKKIFRKLSKEIGKLVAKLHDNDIVHGDLTTSNMILHEDPKKGIYFIDFGLSFFSSRDEDKAVDLHLLKQALESKHHNIFEEAFDHVLKGYGDYKFSGKIIDRLKKVEARGRNKGKH
ncbi:KEOPS complex kinase/ATPase Bud32 [Nanoarchaeota archaeon]